MVENPEKNVTLTVPESYAAEIQRLADLEGVELAEMTASLLSFALNEREQGRQIPGVPAAPDITSAADN